MNWAEHLRVLSRISGAGVWKLTYNDDHLLEVIPPHNNDGYWCVWMLRQEEHGTYWCQVDNEDPKIFYFDESFNTFLSQFPDLELVS